MNYVYYASLVAVGLRSKIVRRRSSSGQPASRRRLKASLDFQAIAGLALLLALTAPGSLLRAQTIYGSISGVVQDPSGAVMPGVAVTVRESSTTTEYKTVTNKSGSYRVSFLKPGGYTVRFEKDGFAQDITDELNIVLNQALVVDRALRLGTNSEVVTVTGAASSMTPTHRLAAS
jgi:Carboxypeptidase regulatory-like domain